MSGEAADEKFLLRSKFQSSHEDPRDCGECIAVEIGERGQPMAISDRFRRLRIIPFPEVWLLPRVLSPGGGRRWSARDEPISAWQRTWFCAATNSHEKGSSQRLIGFIRVLFPFRFSARFSATEVPRHLNSLGSPCRFSRRSVLRRSGSELQVLPPSPQETKGHLETISWSQLSHPCVEPTPKIPGWQEACRISRLKNFASLCDLRVFAVPSSAVAATIPA